MPEKVRASKENCSKARNIVMLLLDGKKTNMKQRLLLTRFLDAAERKLPKESTYAS